MPTTLLNLPTELLFEISTHLKPPEVQLLRLTCQKFNQVFPTPTLKDWLAIEDSYYNYKHYTLCRACSKLSPNSGFYYSETEQIYKCRTCRKSPFFMGARSRLQLLLEMYQISDFDAIRGPYHPWKDDEEFIEKARRFNLDQHLQLLKERNLIMLGTPDLDAHFKACSHCLKAIDHEKNGWHRLCLACYEEYEMLGELTDMHGLALENPNKYALYAEKSLKV